jgi:dihydroorotate dehydrogenase electron transfer subunit
MELPEVLKIKSIKDENWKTRTFFFDKKIKVDPGQFMMLWVPGIDEKPFSLSFDDPLGLTVARIGPFTEKLFQMKKDDKVGLRGPYGHGFELKGKNICLVSGGCGCAPILLLAKNAKLKKMNITSILGAKTKNDLLLVDEMKKYTSEIVITTDDGSFGKKGFTTDVLKELLNKKSFDCVYTCGPEIMMKKVFDICESFKIMCQASLERYMKCGFGACGQCCIDGIRVCKDGPVVDSNQLKKLSEFGVFTRNKSGTKNYF